MYNSTDNSDSLSKSDSSSLQTPPRPLGRLRVSSLPTDTWLQNTQKPQHRKTVKRKTQYSNRLRLKKEKHDPGFALDASLPDTTESADSTREADTTGASETSPNVTNSAVQLASIFIASAKTANAKFNVVSAVHNNQPKYLSGEEGELIQISQAARLRAESAKLFFELKYKWLDKAMGMNKDDPEENADPDGIYNPLQTLRNRPLRKRLRVPNYSAGERNMSLACNAFSSHSQDGKQWKMIWGIDNDEILMDFAWRKFYSNELKDPKGGFWRDTSSSEASSKSDNLSKRLHDVLWVADDAEKSDTDNYLNEVPVLRVRSKDTRKGLTKQLKHKAKKLYSSSAVFESDQELENPASTIPHKSSDSILQLKITHATRDANIEDESIDPIAISRFESDANGDSLDSSKAGDSVRKTDTMPQLLTPFGHETSENGSFSKTTTEDVTRSDDALGGIPSIHFNPIIRQEQEELAESAPKEDNAMTDPRTKEVMSELQRLPLVVKKGAYTKSLVSISLNYWDNIQPLISDDTESRLNYLLNHAVSDLFQSIYDINSSSIPPQEIALKGFVEEVKALNHLANEECATKIDNLLSATDRSYGELNTSLLMELRKTSEQIDRMNRSLFGSGISRFNSEDEPIQMASFGEHRVLYLALENFIVIVLRLIWIFVTIFKFFLRVLGLFWHMARLLRHLFP